MTKFYALAAIFLFFACSKNNNSPFSPTPLAPTITTIAPDSGIVGTEIVITGTNFSTTSTEDTVQINGVTAPVNFATTTQLNITIPAGASTGKVTVNVNGQSAKSINDFIVLTDTSRDDVYIAAFDNGDLTYWKNGTEVTLSTTPRGFYGNVYGIGVLNNDVYVSGYVGDTAVYWKNGVENYLASFDLGNEVATSMVVSGSDVYIVGYEERNDGNYMVYWKNGNKTIVDKTTSGIYTSAKIAVSGNDVYVAATIGNDTAVYWKNGTRTTLAAPHGDAYAIAIAGTDVIVAGVHNATPVYWKNGVMNSLPYTIQSASYSIAMSGNDTYIVGVDNGNAVYWKNGTEIILGGGAANDIAISGSDVYITGYCFNFNAPLNTYSCYWKNGVRVNFVGTQTGITGSDISGNAITVVRH